LDDDAPGNPRVGVERLFRDHAEFVASFLRRLGVPEADVDDAVQEVFTVAHRKGGFEPGRATARSWLGAIAVRAASTWRRTLRRRREVFDPSGVAVPEGSAIAPQNELEARQALRRVERALATLDIKLRAVFVLYEMEDEDCQAIAAALDLPVGTVYSRLHAARKRFTEAHTELLQEGDGSAPQPVAGPVGGVGGVL